jgi:hypothetical protein
MEEIFPIIRRRERTPILGDKRGEVRTAGRSLSKAANFRLFGVESFCIKSGFHKLLINLKSKTVKLNNSIVLK